MTVKDLAQITGLTTQAIYKKLKANGLTMGSLKDKQTGHLTQEGEAIIRDLFGLSETEPKTENASDNNKLNGLTTELTTLRSQVEKLTTELTTAHSQITTLETQVGMLTEERDFLRMTLERSQHLEAAAIAKLPSPPRALPPGEEKKNHGLRGWFNKMRGGHK